LNEVPSTSSGWVTFDRFHEIYSRSSNDLDGSCLSRFAHRTGHHAFVPPPYPKIGAVHAHSSETVQHPLDC